MNTRRKEHIKDLFASPGFLAMLLVKIVAGCFLGSYYLVHLFTPFVNYFVVSGFQDPWTYFYNLGQTDVFPYNPLMLWILSVPRLLLSPFLSGDWQQVSPLHLFSMRMPILLADLTIYVLLCGWFRNSISRVRSYYWYSSVLFYISYFHGQLDVIPTALFFVSLYLLKRNLFLRSMLCLGLALGAKSHLLVAVPFLAVYLRQFMSLQRVASYVMVSLGVFLFVTAPFLLSEGFQRIVLHSEVQKRVFAYTLQLPMQDLVIYLCPAALVVLFLRFVAYPKQNWDLTMLYLALSFCTFVMLVPPMQGWFMWAYPFLAYFFCRDERLNRAALSLFSVSFLSYFLLGNSSDLFQSFQVASPSLAAMPGPGRYLAQLGLNPSLLQGLSFTLMETSLGILILMIYKIGVRSNEVYGVKERPTLVGIAGDSGAGKDTLVGVLADVVGVGNLIAVSGDDYHRWERGNKNWEVFTHLDVRSNRLHQLLDHTIALQDGRSICKVRYCHKTGKFTNPEQLDPSKYIAVAGLHTFVLDKMRGMFDLKIFLDPDEDLRYYWKAKRDVTERGHSLDKVVEALKRREKDRVEHILPQREVADVIFSLKPKSKVSLENLNVEPELALQIEMDNSFDVEVLVEALREVSGAGVEHFQITQKARQVLVVSGNFSARDIEIIAHKIIPNLGELTRELAFYQSDLNGIMQLVLLTCLSSCLRWKTLKHSSDSVFSHLRGWTGERLVVNA